ncbi:MAG: NAD(P)-dependent glycerol-3-phosphate dehydrogenase [Hyphomicrobiales bacterium]|nr:NAD(P)-dependent glycerol-3-phosphate dehydrogenase [Hyphomicrobiales bacterium]
MAEVVVLGAGAWGTALALVAARDGRAVSLWARDADAAEAINAARENRARLPGVRLPACIRATPDLAALQGARLIVAAVPAQAVRGTARDLAKCLPPGVPLVLCAKGIERDTGAFLTGIVSQILPGTPLAVLSGPSFAEDVSIGLPTAVTLACAQTPVFDLCREVLGAPWFRLYHSTDLRGVEIGAAAKNVLAIACGMAAGRRLGGSANAALIARSFAELARFGRAYGARPETLTGLSGLGDLVLTCQPGKSRNFAYGEALGRGEAPPAKLAEGALTAPVLAELARARDVDMPISFAVDAILKGETSVGEAITALLARPSRSE